MIPRLLAVLLGLAAAGSADVTLRYSFNVQPGPMVPPQAVEAMKSQMKMPMTMMSVLKGNKAYAEIMGMTAITNFDGALVSIIDAANKRYATVSSTEYAGAVGKTADLPPEARQVIANMKMDVTSRSTGRTKIIKGIRAEERELVLTMELPAGPQGSLGAMRMVYSVWAPDSDALVNNAAMREFAEYCTRAYVGLNPGDMIGKMFGQAPAFAEKLKAMTEEFKNMRVMLESHMAMYMPGMAAMMEQLRKAGKPVPQMDPNTPFMEMTMQLDELSTAEVPDSRFEIPRDYAPAPLADVLKSVLPKRTEGTIQR